MGTRRRSLHSAAGFLHGPATYEFQTTDCRKTVEIPPVVLYTILGGILSYFGIFLGLYFICWGLDYSMGKREVKQWNEKLNE